MNITLILTFFALGARSPLSSIGFDAVFHNPANLCLKDNPDYSLRLASLNLFAMNNILSYRAYHRYFGGDSEMDEKEKVEIFRAVPNNGFLYSHNLNFSAIDFSYRNFGGAFRRFDLMNLKLSKELIDLVLFGNQLGRTYELSDFSLDYLSYYSFNFASALPIIKKKKEFAAIGIGLKYLLGENVNLTKQFLGKLYSDEYLIQGNITWVRTVATQGHGFGIDFGATYELERFRASLCLLNLSSGILWTQNPKNNIRNLGLDSFTVYNAFKFGVLDSVYRAENLFTPIEPFRTALPMYLTLGAGWKIDNFGSLLSFVYEKNLVQTKFLTFTQKLTLNLELNLLQFIMVNPSISFVSKEGLAFALRLEKKIRRFLVEISLEAIQSPIVTRARGLKFGLSLGITPP